MGNWTKPLPLGSPTRLYNESFATFGVNYDLDQDSFTFYINETTVGYHSGISKQVDSVHAWYHILNYAVGGPWGGFPSQDTVFPTTMECDFARHYKPKSKADVGAGGAGMGA